MIAFFSSPGNSQLVHVPPKELWVDQVIDLVYDTVRYLE